MNINDYRKLMLIRVLLFQSLHTGVDMLLSQFVLNSGKGILIDYMIELYLLGKMI